MTTEQSRALARRWYLEILAQGRLDLVDELFTSDCLSHAVYGPPGGWPRGPEAARVTVQTWRAVVPDVQFRIEEQIAVGDKVATRWTGWGTNHGTMFGHPPTGQSFVISGISMERIAAGKIAEVWICFDVLGLLQQIGMLPAPDLAGL